MELDVLSGAGVGVGSESPRAGRDGSVEVEDAPFTLGGAGSPDLDDRVWFGCDFVLESVHKSLA